MNTVTLTASLNKVQEHTECDVALEFESYYAKKENSCHWTVVRTDVLALVQKKNQVTQSCQVDSHSPVRLPYCTAHNNKQTLNSQRFKSQRMMITTYVRDQWIWETPK